MKKLSNKENPYNSYYNKELSRLKAVSIASAVRETKEMYNYTNSLLRIILIIMPRAKEKNYLKEK